MPNPRYLQLFEIDNAALAAEATAGLLAGSASVSPKFFYDELGSRLFEAITALPEYYPTRTEAAIFDAHGQAMADAARSALGERLAFVDLGAGSCTKAARLMDLVAPSRYVAVDISVAFVQQALARLQREHPAIEMVGVGMDLSQALVFPAALRDRPALMFYPGSSIGNFTPDEALALLRQVRQQSQEGALLIGVDLVKDRSTLELAYDDPLGVTAAFNLNLLSHLNRLIGADFAVRDWQHVAFFDKTHSRIEMHLQARRPTTVRWPGGERSFAEGERIHTENSYKWRREDFEALLRDAGYKRAQTWCDDREWFAVMLASG